jgi:hypothetical protein
VAQSYECVLGPVKKKSIFWFFAFCAGSFGKGGRARIILIAVSRLFQRVFKGSGEELSQAAIHQALTCKELISAFGFKLILAWARLDRVGFN